MSRAETYPWSMLTEVGDYFVVPESFKPFDYMRRLVAQTNYKGATNKRFMAMDTQAGTIVMLGEIKGETPPHEFISAEGILSSTSRGNLRAQVQNPQLGHLNTERPKRTQQQIIDNMHWEVRSANLPWWFDNKGNLVANPKVIKEPEATKWYKRELKVGPEDPYPEHYYLDENLLYDERIKQMLELTDEDEYFEEYTPAKADTIDVEDDT